MRTVCDRKVVFDVCFEPKFTKFIAGSGAGFSGQGNFSAAMSGGRQWQGRRNQDDEEEEDDELNVSSSAGRTSRSTTNDNRKGAVCPPPLYDGNREAGVFEEFRIRAKLWLYSTNVESRARGPRLLQALSGKAFESVRHLIDEAEWLEAVDNGEQLLELLSKPEYYGTMARKN